ncbi:MAG: hypothetical protein J6K21_01520 [Bacilli bacterium]|nr:hypothetical protein [Bacilli bacterium]
MLNFGYLDRNGSYLEKSFIVNNATKYQKEPTNILLLENKETIKEEIKKHYKNEKIINIYFFKSKSTEYELVLTDASLLLFNNIVVSEKYLELIDENKIKLIDYYIELMQGKREINEVYYNIYNIFKSDNIEIQNKLLKKIKRY